MVVVGGWEVVVVVAVAVGLWAVVEMRLRRFSVSERKRERVWETSKKRKGTKMNREKKTEGKFRSGWGKM